MIVSSMVKNGIILAIFAIVTTGLVTLTHSLTASEIKLQEKKELLKTLEQVLPPETYNNQLYLDCTKIKATFLGKSIQTVYRARKDGKPVALILESTAPDGYSGNIELLTAVYLNGTVAGVRVLKHKETPGLGDKVELSKSDWILSFENKQVKSTKDMRWAVTKDNGMFDQFTGATITPRAVISAVKRTSIYAKNEFRLLFDAPNLCIGDK